MTPTRMKLGINKLKWQDTEGKHISQWGAGRNLGNTTTGAQKAADLCHSCFSPCNPCQANVRKLTILNGRGTERKHGN
jgi:hypothetical protein